MNRLALIHDHETKDPTGNDLDAEPAPMQRLDRAINTMNATMARQRREVARFREEIAELDSVVSDLGGSLREYSRVLDNIDWRRLHRKVNRLSVIMTV